jgi:hypothetical protein
MLSIVRIARFAVVGAALAGCTFEPPANAVPDSSPDVPPVNGGGRVVDEHLIGMWRFAEGGGTTAGDTVTLVRPDYTKKPMDLTIESPTGYRWSGTEGLQIDAPVVIRSGPGMGNRPHMTAEVNASGAVTLELWVTPAEAMPAGMPGAIFSLGSGPSNCNVRIQQAGSRFVGCARTVATPRGPEQTIPTPMDTAKAALQHVVLVADGATRTLHVDGMAHPAPAAELAPMMSWNDTFRISIGDEAMGGGAWRGTLWFAAVYDRALTEAEVAKNRAAGHDCASC